MPLVVEVMEGVRSAAVHWLLPAGSATDSDELEGRGAMLEELLLRGTRRHTSREHADAADRLGASRSVGLGTFTMGVSSAMLGSKVRDVLPLLTEMVREPRLDEDSIVACRDLCVQAIESLKDEPQERAMVLARARHYAWPMCRSGMGTPAGLAACNAANLREGWEKLAKPRGSVIAVAGAVNAAEVAARLDELLRGWEGAAPEVVRGPAPVRGYGHEQDDGGSQVQIIVAYDAPPEPSAESVLERVVVGVLSGGMSGRLFSEVREKRGLCYSVSAGYRGDRDYGGVWAYVGTTPERAQQSLDVLVEQLQKILTPAGRVTPEEFERAKIGLKSGLVFSGESSGARAGALATDYRRLGRARSLTEVAAQIDAVTLDQVNEYLAKRRLGRVTVQTLGPSALKSPLE